MKPQLKYIEGDNLIDKPLDAKTIEEIVGRVSINKLTPPYFPDYSEQKSTITPFKKRLLDLFKRRVA